MPDFVFAQLSRLLGFRRQQRSLLWLAAAIALACGSADPVAPAHPPTPPAAPPKVPVARLLGDTVAYVGRTGQFFLAFTDTLGVYSDNAVSFTATNERLVFVRLGTFLGRVSGPDTLLVSTPYGPMPFVVNVIDDRPEVHLTLGDSVAGPMANGLSVQRIAIDLAAGDTIDLQVTGLTFPWIVPVAPGGAGTPAAPEERVPMLGAYVARQTGTYHFSVASDVFCSSKCTPDFPYVLRVRRSAPVLSIPRVGGIQRVAQGSTGRDTIWIQNLGTGAAVLSAKAAAASWLMPTPTTAIIPGPTPLIRDVAPKGSVAIVAQLDARGVGPGTYTDELVLTPASPVWSPTQTNVRELRSAVTMIVYDSSARIVSPSVAASRLVVGPSGALYGLARSRILRLDAVTGASTTVVDLATSVAAPTAVNQWVIFDLAVGRADSLYVSYWSPLGSGIALVSASGVVRTIATYSNAFVPGVVALSNGVVYVHADTSAYRIQDGVSSRVGTLPVRDFYGALLYNGRNNSLYAVDTKGLSRLDLGTGRATIIPLSTALDALGTVDDAGRLYALGAGVVWVLNTDGGVLYSLVPPAPVTTVAVLRDALFGTGHPAFDPTPTTGYGLWRAPLR